MSRSKHNSKGPGFEFWSRRPGKYFYSKPTRKAKRITHRLERIQKQNELRKLKDEE